MRKVALGIVIGALAAFAWNRLHRPASDSDATARLESQEMPAAPDSPANDTPARTNFKCDGRIYCSQMTSCEEAEFFLENCPGVKMDGGGDGVPCERQWCGNR